MSPGKARDSVEDYGTAVDEQKMRVKCNFCGKGVRGYNRLKHHLADMGSDVVACLEVPADVKDRMRGALLQKKKERLVKEVGQLDHPELPLKRNFSPAPIEQDRLCQMKLTESSTTKKGKKAAETAGNSINGIGSHVNPFEATSRDGENVKTTMSEQVENGRIPASVMMEGIKPVIKEEVKDESLLLAKRSIGMFFFDAGIDPVKVKLPSFKCMIDSVIACGAGVKEPTYDELRGWILQQELKEVLGHVEDVKQCWQQTGCSIVLDSWVDKSGRSLISFLVNCPYGTVFLRSKDVSDAVEDVDALFSLLCEVVEEVGSQNVVQVISHDTSPYMQFAGQKLVEKYRSMFWTLCADYCVNLILENIAAVEDVGRLLNQAKTMTRFIYGHAVPLQLMKKYTQGCDLVKTSHWKFVAQFATLQEIVSHRENLTSMFSSHAWNASVWASRDKGKSISDLVKSQTFWAAAAEILKVTNPLINVLNQIFGGDKGPMALLYDAMDRAKIKIKMDLGSEEKRFRPFWDMIDDIWNNYLHSSFHSAGYYLNPSLFYSEKFYCDAEVTTGLTSWFVHMARDQNDQDLIVKHLETYRTASGGFGEEIAIDDRRQIPPVLWWSLHGGECPELQRLAIRTVCQTCSGASRYNLEKNLSEQLHAATRSCLEQQILRDREFVHYNRNLWRPACEVGGTSNLFLGKSDHMADWVAE